MKHVIATFICILLLISCGQKKNDVVDIVTDETSSDELMEIQFAKSQIRLPFDGNIAAYNLKYDSLVVLDGIEKYLCGSKNLTYVSLPNKDSVHLIIVPVHCNDYLYKYYIMSVKNNKLVSALYVEGDWTDANNKKIRETKWFSIERDYTINVTTNRIEGNTQYFEYKRYQINTDGNIVESETGQKKTEGNCFGKESRIAYPLSSANLPNLKYTILDCENIDGMRNYSCYDGVSYVNLKRKADGKLYVLIYSECEEYSFTDLLVIQNNQIISGLTIDGESFLDDSSIEFSEETSFQMDENFNIKLIISKISGDNIVSSTTDLYKIADSGRIVKIGNN